MNLLLWTIITDSITMVRDIDAEIEVLKGRIASVEKRPQLKYSGVYSAERVYEPGEFVTRSGAVALQC